MTKETARLARALWWINNGKASDVQPVIADLASNATTHRYVNAPASSCSANPPQNLRGFAASRPSRYIGHADIALFRTYTRVEQRVREVNQEVGEDDRAGRDDDGAHDDGRVAVENRVDRELTEPGQRKSFSVTMAPPTRLPKSSPMIVTSGKRRCEARA